MKIKENEYRHRIFKVVDFIELNYSKNLSLEQLSSIANFSKFHFHRVFYSVIGENLFEFIQRIRIEKAAAKLYLNKSMPISDIAYDCGFSNPSSFARVFKECFGMNATEWRSQAIVPKSNSSKSIGNKSRALSNRWKMIDNSVSYFCDESNKSIIKWSCKMLNKTELTVNVKEYEAFDVAYIRHIGPYKGDSALFDRLYGQICGWAGPRGLITSDTKFISVYYDDPEITEESKLRLDVCLSIPPDTQVNAPFGKMKIPKGKYAVCLFNLGPKDYPEAWNFIYGEWLPNSGFQPDDRPSYENYLSSPKDDPNGNCKVEILVPVKPV